MRDAGGKRGEPPRPTGRSSHGSRQGGPRAISARDARRATEAATTRPDEAQGEARAAARAPEQQRPTEVSRRRQPTQRRAARSASRRNDSGAGRRARGARREAQNAALASDRRQDRRVTQRRSAAAGRARRVGSDQRAVPAEAPSRRPKLSLLSRYSDRRRAEGTAPVPRAGARPKHSRREQRDAAQRRPPSLPAASLRPFPCL